MGRDLIERVLAEHPFTHDFSASDREGLAALAQRRTYGPDEWLIREGRAADALFLIVDGLVALEVFVPERGAIRVQTVGAGEVIGWSWVVPPYRWAFDARAVMKTDAIVFEAERLRALMEQDPRLGYRILHKLLGVVAERLKATRLQLMDIYAPPGAVTR